MGGIGAPYFFGRGTPTAMVWVIRGETAIAPNPLAAGEVGPQRGALAVASVTAGTRGARDLAAVDAPAERDLFGRCSGRRRQRACCLRAGVRMDAFRRNGGGGRRIVGSRGGNR